MEKFARLIRDHQSFLITTHALPDGDGLGSAVALHLYLEKMGKKAFLWTPSPVPAKFGLLDPARKIKVYSLMDSIPTVDVIFIMDTNELKMLGALQKPVEGSKAVKVFVDHHVRDTQASESEHLIDEKCSSTGELVYNFLEHLKADLDTPMALALYVAILTDTASFRYKRTTARSHQIASELLKKGVLPERVYQEIYARDSLAKTRLYGRVMEGLQLSSSGKVVWGVVTDKDRTHFGASIEDTESFIDHLTHIAGVQICILFREEADGVVKVSLRGNGDVPVFDIARKFGGGGHRHAAGARIKGVLADVSQQVCEAAEKSLE